VKWVEVAYVDIRRRSFVTMVPVDCVRKSTTWS